MDVQALSAYSTSSPGQAMVIVRFLVGENEEAALVRLNQKIYARIHEWRNRPIAGEHPYVYLDGVWLSREFGGEVKPVAVLVAIGVIAFIGVFIFFATRW